MNLLTLLPKGIVEIVIEYLDQGSEYEFLDYLTKIEESPLQIYYFNLMIDLLKGYKRFWLLSIQRPDTDVVYILGCDTYRRIKAEFIKHFLEKPLEDNIIIDWIKQSKDFEKPRLEEWRLDYLKDVTFHISPTTHGGIF